MVNNHYSLANPKLVEEIESKRPYVEKFVKECPDCYLVRRQRLQRESIKHSIDLELGRVNNLRELKREKKRCLTNLANAYGWGYTNFQMELSEDLILGIGERIEPEVNHGGYRIASARHKYLNILPPRPEKIEGEINNFLFFLNCFDSSIDRAIYSHFHIFRIHPFGDGNKRSARLIQNLYLEKEKLLPITIELDDRKSYIDILSTAVKSHNNVITELRDDSSSNYNLIIQGIRKPSVTLKELAYYRDLGVKLIAEHISLEERAFYDFLVEKLRDLFYTEFNKQSNKRLDNCCRKEFRELTKDH